MVYAKVRCLAFHALWPGMTRQSFQKMSPNPIRLGLVALSDCAPIAAAKETGIFERHGLQVKLSKELGWATIRDKIYYGELDAAQSIAGMAMTLGLGCGDLKCDVVVPLVLNLHGNAITLTTEMPASAIQSGEGLKAYLTHYWKKTRPFTLAAPHRHASHHILLHGWLRRHGLNPHEEAEIVFLPPSLMPRHLKAGHIDGYCVGEPWNSASILGGMGWCPATSADLSYGHPEKVLLVAGRFLQEQPDQTTALVSALLEACRMCQDPAFKDDLIRILSLPEYTGASPELLRNSLCGKFETGRGVVDENPFHLFHGDEVNRPTVEKASWLLAGLRTIGALPEITAGSISRIHREDLFHAATALA